MSDVIIYLDPNSKLNLQNQIRQKLVDGIQNGAFPPGIRLILGGKFSIKNNMSL